MSRRVSRGAPLTPVGRQRGCIRDGSGYGCSLARSSSAGARDTHPPLQYAGERKIRVGVQGKGKRGGARVIYYHVRERQVMYMLVAHEKGEADNLSAAGKKLMRRLTKELDNE